MRAFIQLMVMLLRVRASARHAGLTWKETMELISDSSEANLDWMSDFPELRDQKIKIRTNKHNLGNHENGS